MTGVFVRGYGVVSPAGWGLEAFRSALDLNTPLPVQELKAPDRAVPLSVRTVPAPKVRAGFLAQARLRRTSPISHYLVASALEALGEEAELIKAGKLRLGIILSALSGCVNYSKRFYDETLRNPATASPLVFPETVYNAPSSHLSALLGSTGINYTIVGDPGTFLVGVALGANWLMTERVDRCLVLASEEMDWLIADALTLFQRRGILADGAAALYLSSEPGPAVSVELDCVSDPQLFTRAAGRSQAARSVRNAVRSEHERGGLLCDSLQGAGRIDDAEMSAWADWPGARISPKRLLGEGLTAAAGWQCIAAADALVNGAFPTATVNIVGCNQQAIAARFVRNSERKSVV